MHFRSLYALPVLAALSLTPALFAFDHDDDNLTNMVYVQSNNPGTNQNAILAYRRNPSTGALTEISGSPFLTGGTGYYNVDERLGPDDTDLEIAVTKDHRFLYTVNQGSNTVAGFAVQSDGSLRPVPGSPFSSEGVQPGSIAIDAFYLFVANRGDKNPGEHGSHNSNYSGFLILPNGSLISVPWAQLGLGAGASPTQLLVANSGRLIFDSHLFENPFTIPPGFPPFVPPFSGALHSYRVGILGQLIPAATITPPAGFPPFILGLITHPTRKILYTGFVLAGGVGTYTYDDNGGLAFAGFSPGTGVAPCWLRVTPDGKTLFTADAATDEIEAYSLADPLHPAHLQTVDLKGPKTPLGDPAAASVFDTTPFQIDISPDGKFLYVVNHEATLANNAPHGNAIHTLKISANGTLTETAASPLILPLGEEPSNGHPLGIVVF